MCMFVCVWRMLILQRRREETRKETLRAGRKKTPSVLRHLLIFRWRITLIKVQIIDEPEEEILRREAADASRSVGELREFRSMFGMVEAPTANPNNRNLGKEVFLGGPLRKHAERDELGR